jgi:hypothetical protein
MEGITELNSGPAASLLMHDSAFLAVDKNGGEPIPRKPENAAALEAAQERLRAAGIHTGPCAINASVGAA